MRPLSIVLLLAIAWPGISLAAEADLGVSVRRRTDVHVYLDGGSLDGLQVGQEFGVYRDDELVGRVQVVFVAAHSSTARIAAESVAIGADDRLGPLRPAVQFQVVGAAVPQPPRTAPDGGERSMLPAAPVGATAGDQEEAPARRPTRVRGTVRLGWERFDPTATDAPTTGDLSGRFNLGVQDLGGGPWNIDMRVRLRQVDHGAARDEWYDATEARHRLYQLSLAYAPPDGRFAARFGRIGVNPFVGVGYLDGLLAEARLTSTLGVGGFVGAVPQLDGIGIDVSQKKYGGFARLHLTPGGNNDVQILAAGIRESYENGSNRDYVVAEVDWSAGPRLTLMQRVELDLARPEVPGASNSSLANFSFMGNYRVSSRSHVSLSYVRSNWLPYDASAYEIPWTGTPAAVDRLQLMVSFPVPGQIAVALRGGMRKRADIAGPTYFGGVAFNRSWRNGLWIGASADAQSGEEYRGYGLGAKVGKRWRVGFSALAEYHYLRNEDRLSADPRGMQWAAFTLAQDIGNRAFIEGAAEFSTGELLDGRRFYFGLGYHF